MDLKKELRRKDRRVGELEEQLKGLQKGRAEDHPGMVKVIEKHTMEKTELVTEINRLNQQILILREGAEKSREERELKQISDEQGEKRKVYDKLLFQERQIEGLQNKLTSALDDNQNLRLLLQSNEESEFDKM